MDSKDKVSVVVKAADDKRAHDIVALNVEQISLMADYFIIMDAASSRQVKAIAEAIVDEAEKADITIKQVEGKNAANWILIDLGDVIVHVFQREQREFYDLEKLWSDAAELDISNWVTE
ncbi:ribosome silencing factor [Nicoliella spurrieriana]|uniref:Ribosomal silencing factor RsfS n=1 Tax=Nicoliella spurrieriana TaxID=2925830 RepID=A0A976X5I4_9LACO|nr:ribosome silencing factor [Nicoliella spurrieriana]UQS86699.1 ribosome silencing factor [Nicoliella spurrieriana]